MTKISEALNGVLERLKTVSRECGRENPPRLIAVAKTKPVEAVVAAYNAGQRHFGENYIQELVRKSKEVDGEVRWHFIGPLQSNKAKMLVGVKGLEVVESVDRKKIADVLNREALAQGREGLKIMVQVNTSGEQSKSGCEAVEAVKLTRHVVDNCRGLTFVGLMTIGKPDTSERPEAFDILKEVRQNVARDLGRREDELELSMGMSGDFEAATRMGSTSVRVGSIIFGARDYSGKT